MGRTLARHKLNATKIKSRTSPGLLGDGGGLWLRVARGGTKSWVFRYMLEGRAREMGLGPWPDRTLDEARERALEARRLLLDGHDPIDCRKSKRQTELLEAARAMSFDDCAKAYIDSQRAGWKNAKHAAQWETTLATYVSPIFGKVSVQAVDVDLILKCLQPIWQRIPETASRVRNRIELVLDFATARKFRSGDNPARWRGHLDKLLPKISKAGRVKHFKALPFDEIGEFVSKLRTQAGVSPRALEYTILTAARSGETRGARWEEIDLETGIWTIPAERMKAKREHRIPLSPRALEILNGLEPDSSGLVFAGNKGKPLSDMSLSAVLRRMKVDTTVHGFRSTFRDWIGERTSVPREIAEASLAHVVSDKVEAAYRRGDFFEKRRDLMKKWANYCEMTSFPRGEVLEIGNRVIQQ